MSATTHPIGYGTRNLSANIPTDEWEAYRREASAAGLGLGAWVRDTMLAGLRAKNERTAAEVREIRRRYYGAALLLVFIAFIAFDQGNELRRARRQCVRVVRVQRREMA
jgi:hypothetical protein